MPQSNFDTGIVYGEWTFVYKAETYPHSFFRRLLLHSSRKRARFNGLRVVLSLSEHCVIYIGVIVKLCGFHI